MKPLAAEKIISLYNKLKTGYEPTGQELDLLASTTLAQVLEANAMVRKLEGMRPNQVYTPSASPMPDFELAALYVAIHVYVETPAVVDFMENNMRPIGT